MLDLTRHDRAQERRRRTVMDVDFGNRTRQPRLPVKHHNPVTRSPTDELNRLSPGRSGRHRGTQPAQIQRHQRTRPTAGIALRILMIVVVIPVFMPLVTMLIKPSRKPNCALAG